MTTGRKIDCLFIDEFDLSLSDRIGNLEIIDGAAFQPGKTAIVGSLCKDAEATFEGECILNPNAMRKLLGLDLATYAIDAVCNIGCNTYSLQFLCNNTMMVPVRKHRKKRIAKKWAKKYGYKYVLVPKRLESVSLVNDNEIDILGRTERRIVR